jgi:ComF family protein
VAVLSSHFVREWASTLLDLTFPEHPLPGSAPERVTAPYCSHCGDPFEGDVSDHFECYKCAGRTSYFSWARSAYRAAGQVREAVHGFKYEGQFFQRRQLIEWLEHGFSDHAVAISWEALVPVPLHPLRRRERGFNQSLELAQGLGRSRSLPVWDCLQRQRETSSQTSFDREQRWRNLRDAFAFKPGFDVQGKDLLLIDDVYTTGATCESCARTLRQAGAATVGVLTVARS